MLLSGGCVFQEYTKYAVECVVGGGDILDGGLQIEVVTPIDVSGSDACGGWCSFIELRLHYEVVALAGDVEQVLGVYIFYFL